MKVRPLDELQAFAVVAEELSFTRAAARLGVTQSSLSRTLKQLEERLGVRLLARTTRSVGTTEAGERLLRSLRPALQDIDRSLTALGELRSKPSGPLRITTPRHPALAVVRPVLKRFLSEHPDIELEVTVEDALVDLVAARYDAGIRLGERIERDMIAVRISGDIRMAVVGSPAYFANRPPPQSPRDLAEHLCINYRESSSGGLYAWEFDDHGQALSVRVSGPLVSNDTDVLVSAAIDGIGLSYVFEGQVEADLKAGRLVRVLAKYCDRFPGFFLYYPSRRQAPPALTALVSALRAA